MTLLSLPAVPAFAGLVVLAVRRRSAGRAALVLAALAHAALTAAACATSPPAEIGGWVGLDAPGRLFLGITSVLFLGAAVYAVGYLRRERPGPRRDFQEALQFANEPEAVFTACLLFFLAAMTLVCLSQRFELLWVGVEATTLASAPLIYFHRHHRSLEAAWKYLLICSVGIALALLGNFFLAVAAAGRGGAPVPLILGDLLAAGPRLDPQWLSASFILLLVGYGTKMGLAPLHTWLPDAHGEAPSVVSALLSGALLNCAFLGILRAQQVCAAAGEAPFGRHLLILFGLISLAFAAAFIAGQVDYKRMLAYSSVEHMGILALGDGLGGAATVGAMLHAVNHSLTKAMLFLVAGNILAVYRSKSAGNVQGVLHFLPVSGTLWVAGFLAITGTPPFGPFLSELMILKGAIEGGIPAVAVAYLALLAGVFVGMAAIVLRMAQGRARADAAAAQPEPLLAIAPPAVLALGVLVLGVYVPPALRAGVARHRPRARAARQPCRRPRRPGG